MTYLFFLSKCYYAKTHKNTLTSEDVRGGMGSNSQKMFFANNAITDKPGITIFVTMLNIEPDEA